MAEMKKSIIVLVLIALLPVVSAIPSITLQFHVNDATIDVDYQLSSDMGCEEATIFHNGQAHILSVGVCDASGTITVTKAESNEFYASILYVNGGFQTLNTPVQTVNGEDTTAPSANNLRFIRNGQPITAISTGTKFMVDVVFDITENDLESMKVDLSGITTDPVKSVSYADVPIEPALCSPHDGVFTCVLSGRELLPTAGSATVVLSMVDSSGNANTVTLTKDFTVSNNKPLITFFGTDTCYEDVCYIRDGMNTVLILFTGSSAGFSSKQVYYSAAGTNGRPYQCTNTECLGTLNTQCTNGPVSLYLTTSGTNPSQDDAGNLIGGVTTQTISCDNIAPQFNGEIHLQSDSGLDFFKFGDTVIVKVNVSENVHPQMILNFSEFGGGVTQGQCVYKQYQWECIGEGQVGAKSEGYTANLRITIRDVVGNTVSKSVPMQVLSIDTQSIPNLWTAGSANVQPTVFNKKFIPLLDNNIYVHVPLKRLKAGAETLYVIPTGCVAQDGYGNAGLIEASGREKLISKERGATELLLKLNLRKSRGDYDQFSELRFMCTLDVYSRWGTIFFDKPEQENYTVNIRLIETDDVGDNIQNEIDNVLEDIDKSLNTGIVADLRKFTEKMVPICYVMPTISGVQATLATTSATLEPFPPTKGVSDSLQRTSDKLGAINDGFFGSKYALQTCRFITCESSVNKAIPKLMGDLPGVDFMTKVAGGDGVAYEDMFDPYKSIYLAWASACAPAIVQLTDKMNAIQCSYAECLSRDVSAGYPISECAATKSYGECKYYTGALFEVVPYTALQRKLGSQLKQILANPAAIVGMGLSYKLCGGGKMGSNIAYAFCSVPQNIKEIKTLLEQFKAWPDFGPSDAVLYCDQVLKNIEPEDGYWRPYDKPESVWNTDYQDSTKGMSCTEEGGCYYTNKPGVNVRDAGAPNSYQLFYNGEYVGDFTVSEAGIVTYNDVDIDAAAKAGKLLTDSELKVLADQSQEYGDYVEGKYAKSLGKLSPEYQEYMKKTQEYADTIKEARYELDHLENDIASAQSTIDSSNAGIDRYTFLIDTYDPNNPPDDLQISGLDGDYQTKTTLTKQELETKREELKNLKKETEKDLKNLNKDKQEQENVVKENTNKLKKEADLQKFEQYNINNEGGWKLWGNMLENAMAIDYITKPLTNWIPGYGAIIESYGNMLKSVFEKDVVQVLFGEYEDILCENKLDKSSQEGQALISTGTFYRPAAHLEGERSELISPPRALNTPPYRNYFVTAGVTAKKGGLQFVIYAYGDNKINITGQEELSEDNPTWPLNAQAIIFNSTRNYDQVCIEFVQKGSTLYEYFDVIEFSNNKICNDIREQ